MTKKLRSKKKKAKNHAKSGLVAPKSAMVLAAGLGLRMRPITDKTPKPLVTVAGRALLDHSLDRLVAAGVEKVVVNVHHLAEQIEQNLSRRKDLDIIVSSEKEDLLETGGGVNKALAYFDDQPFYVSNADILYLDGPDSALHRLAESWQDDHMDCLLLMHSTVEAYGYKGDGDFMVDPGGRLERCPEREISPYLFTGIQLLHPRLFNDSPDGAFSMNVLYDRAIEEERLFGIVHDGDWFHVGTAGGLAEAEIYMRQRFPGMRHR